MPTIDSTNQLLSLQPILSNMRLKSQLQLYLDSRGMTAAELSRRSGVSKQVISQWLGGAGPKKIEQLKAVADTLGTSIDHLAFGDGVEVKVPPTKLDVLLGTQWISGVFEVKLRRIAND